MKLYKLDDIELDELVTDLADRPQPLYFYEYEDNNNTWLLVSEREINEDDIESVFTSRIDDYQEEEDNWD